MKKNLETAGDALKIDEADASLPRETSRRRGRPAGNSMEEPMEYPKGSADSGEKLSTLDAKNDGNTALAERESSCSSDTLKSQCNAVRTG
jgi:hypothetical protein